MSGLPNPRWYKQTNFPDPKTASGSANNALQLQSRSPPTACNIVCTDRFLLKSSKDVTFRFEMVPSPVGSYFLLECRLYTLPEKPTPKDIERYNKEVISVQFRTYDKDGRQYANRQPYNYTSKDNNTPPRGPLGFSQQLFEVTVRPATECEQDKAFIERKDPKQQTWVSWRSEKSIRFNFGLPLDKYSPATQRAANEFKLLMNGMVRSDNRFPIIHVFFYQPIVAKVYWPWFAAIPAPVPESQWPWLYPPNNKTPADIMRFPPNRTFERSEDAINFLLTIRTPTSVLLAQPPVPANPKSIAYVRPMVRFADEREYLAHILGAFAYEDQHAKSIVSRWFNGFHYCLVFPDTALGSLQYMVLLNIHPPTGLSSTDATDLPSPGELVTINLEVNHVQTTYRGTVIRIPSKYAKQGCNVAMVAQAPPNESGRIVTPYPVRADFLFGHHGSPIGKVRDGILELMTDPNNLSNRSAEGWLRELLLAQNLPGLSASNDPTNALGRNYKVKIDEVCKRRQLNDEQRGIVHYYFTHRFTIVRGPPGTGKSTLIDVVLELEETFKQKFWVATESNAAVDVLATKLCLRKRSKQPGQLYRINPTFQETFDKGDRAAAPKLLAITAAPSPSPTSDPPADKRPRPHTMDFSANPRSLMPLRTNMPSPAPSNAPGPARTNAPGPPPASPRLRSRRPHSLDLSQGIPFTGGNSPLASPVAPAKRPEDEIADYLHSLENVKKVMSLEQVIKDRLPMAKHLNSNSQDRLWPKEAQHLLALQQTYHSVHAIHTDGGSEQDRMVQQEAREKAYHEALLKVQIGYASSAKGIFSTAAAACGPLLSNVKPVALIMDEASQFMEARAVSVILHAMKGKKLERVLLIGDDMQLPPTLVATRNPFKESGDVSLFERLILAGFPLQVLTVQYRMHPDISAICNREIYDGVLRNATTTSTRPGVREFRDFVGKLASNAGFKAPVSNSIVISPIRDNDKSLPWGSSRLEGSSSRFNILNARIVLKMVYYLVKMGGFKPDDIMVITFYTDQLTLLRALFEEEPFFSGVVLTTADASQGKEKPVTIVDCVCYGAVIDGLGFLNKDKRRFNVAMSRAQVGRIVIAHKGMIKTTARGKLELCGPWNSFLDEHRKNNAILDGNIFNNPWITGMDFMSKRFNDVILTFLSRQQDNSAKVQHENLARNSRPLERTEIRRTEQSLAEETFMVSTCGTVTDARNYLRKFSNNLSLAIDAFLQEKGSDHLVTEYI